MDVDPVLCCVFVQDVRCCRTIDSTIEGTTVVYNPDGEYNRTNKMHYLLSVYYD
jgi:hypothetical protein